MFFRFFFFFQSSLTQQGKNHHECGWHNPIGLLGRLRREKIGERGKSVERQLPFLHLDPVRCEQAASLAKDKNWSHLPCPPHHKPWAKTSLSPVKLLLARYLIRAKEKVSNVVSKAISKGSSWFCGLLTPRTVITVLQNGKNNEFTRL